MKIEKKVSLSQYSAWKTGGEAEFLCMPENLDQIWVALEYVEENDLSLTIMGHGTNVLISDIGVKGLVLNTRKLSGVESEETRDRLHIKALSGTLKAELLKAFLKKELEPAVFLAGIPGDVGGGVVMNAGIGEQMTPREFVEIVDWIKVFRLENGKRVERTFANNELEWGYRKCKGWQPGVIVEIGLSWPLQKGEDVFGRVKQFNQNRLKKQPLELPNCGSVFRNPLPDKAGALIEDCGLKGTQIGDAQISEKHANFIVNHGNAKSSEIWELIQLARKKVSEQKGIILMPEVVRLGEWS